MRRVNEIDRFRTNVSKEMNQCWHVCVKINFLSFGVVK